ncbi:MAG: hypothetical protein QOE58_320 [Actinomycetota bacterium]|nr:hypothetical protein [Actinomycetota bacterium]
MSTVGQAGTTVRPDGLPGSGETAATPGIPRGGDHPGPPRRVKLSVSRVDPWSVMKLSFLLSVAVGIAGVVMITVLWSILSSMGVFADMNRTVEGLLNTTNTSNGTKFDLMDYIGLGRVVSLSIVVAVIDVILMTAIATLGAFLYNVCSSLVGGLQITLTDD